MDFKLIRENYLKGLSFKFGLIITALLFLGLSIYIITIVFGATIDSIVLNSPANETIMYNNTPEFNFTVYGNQSTYSCELFINGSGYGKTDYWSYQEDYTSYSDLGSGWVAINYTKQNNSVSAKWLVKHGLLDAYNVTIPSNCWNANQNKLLLKIRSEGGDGGDVPMFSYGMCYNGSSWETISQNESIIFNEGGWTSGNIDKIFDGDWETGVVYASSYWRQPSGDFRKGQWKEEAMWWEIEVANNTPTTITTNSTISDGTYNWYINCTADGITEQSEIRELTITKPIDTITLNSPQDQTSTTDNTPDFNFTVSGSESFYSCELFINGSGYGEIKDEWCYQETATTNTTCGGLDTGSYSSDGTWDYIGNTYDENWTTYGKTPSSDANLYITYKKPLNALNSSLWKVKDYEGTTNLSIPSSCWDYNSTELKLRARSRYHGGNYWYCYNGGWQSLRHYIDAYDHTMIYEEAMWWDLGVENNTPTIITANHSISPDGTYNWYINCTASSVTNQSEIREITLDTTAPTTTASAIISNGSSYIFDTLTDSTYVNVTLSCNDGSGVGCDTTYYCLDTGNTCIPTTIYSTPVQISADGVSYIRYYSDDIVGNEENYNTKTIKIDLYNPLISYNANADNGSYVKNWIFINITASDTNKDTVLFEWNGTNETFDNNNGDIYWENKTGLSDGTYTIKAHINDTAGKTNSTLLRNITLDTTAPTTTPTAVDNTGSSYTFNTWTSSTYVNITLSCNDGSGVGCDKTLYCTDTANTCTPNQVYGSAVQVSTSGTSYIRYLSNDTLNNTETVDTQTIKIDSTFPTYSDNSTSSTLAGTNIEHRSKWTDNNLSSGSYIFSWYNGTNWTQTNNSGDKETGEQTFSSLSANEGNYTLRTCSDVWGFDCGAICTAEGDNTYDSCSNCALTDERINEIYINLTQAVYGDNIKVICEYYTTESTNDEMYVYYRNSTTGTWKQKCSGSSSGTGSTVRNWTDCNFAVDNLIGEHQVRCIIAFMGENDECAGGMWYDNDDINFTVVGIGVEDIDANKTPVEYSDIISGNLYEIIDNITATVYVSYYNSSGSIANGNTNATLYLEVYNGTDWINEGDLSIDSTGNFSKVVTTDSILTGWIDESNRDIRISGRYMDYNDSTHFDTINWTGIWIKTDTEQEFLNDSAVTFNSSHCNLNYSACWVNITKAITSSIGATIKWKVFVEDYAGNSNQSEAFTYITIINDTENPTISYNPTTTTAGNHSQNWIFINITASDTNKDAVLFEWNGTNETFDNNNGNLYWENKTGLSDGTYTIKAHINDSAGKTNSTLLRNITLDTTSPTTTPTAVISNGSGYTFNTWTSSTYVNVTLSCNDGSGVGCDKTLYCTDTVNTCTPNQVYSSAVHISTSGTSYIRYLSNDTLNNTEAVNTQTIKIDSTFPTYSDNSTNSTLAGTTIQFNLTINDTIALNTSGQYIFGIDNCTGSFATDSPVNFISTPQTISITKSINATVGCTIRWYYNFSDNTGNWNDSLVSNPFSFTTTTVNTLPTITANATSPPTVYTNTDWLINLTITDPNNDTLIGYVQFYINGISSGSVHSTSPVTNNTNTLIATLGSGNFTKNSNLTAEVWAGDGTDNTTKYNLTQVTVNNLAPTIPTLDLLTSETLTNNNTPFFNWTISTDTDGDSIIYGIQIDNNSDFGSIEQSNYTLSDNNYTATTLTDDIYYWKVKAITSDANSSYTGYRNFTVDTTSPTTTPTAVNNTGGSYTFNTWTSSTYVNVTLSCNDGSGVGCDKTLYCTDTVNTCTPNQVYSSAVHISTENTSYIRFLSNDTVGNDEIVNTQTIKIDTTNPEIQFVTITTETGNYSQTWISANITASDVNFDTIILYLYNSTGIYQQNSTSNTNIYINYTILPKDTYYLNATVNDTLGHTNQTETRTITLDTTAPTTTPTAVLSNGSGYTFNTWTSSTYVNVTLACNDGSGVGCDKTLYCTDTANTCTPNQVYSSAVQISTENTSYIRFLSNDTVGNDEIVNTQTIKIDTNSVTTIAKAIKADSSNYTFNTWTSSNYVDVNLSCNDGLGSGCDITYYCNDTVNSCNPNIEYNGGFIRFSDEGNHYLRYYSIDNVGNNESINNNTIKLDRTSPSTNATAVISNGSSYIFDTWAKPYVNITLSSSDTYSGIDKTLYCTDQSNSCNPDTIYSTPVKINISGTNYFRFMSNDSIGNVETTQSEIVKIDNYPPTTTPSGIKDDGGTYNFGTWTSSTYINVSLSCLDSEVSCDKIYYCNDTVNSCTPITLYSAMFQINHSGTSYVRFKSNDTFGNMENVKNVSILIDTGVPDVIISSPENKDYNVNSIDLNFSATDSNGIDKCWYVLDSGSNQSLPGCNNITLTSLSDDTHILYVYANDTLGGDGSDAVTFMVDTIYPEISYNQTTTTTGNHSQKWIFINITASDTNKDIVLFEWNGTNETFQSNIDNIYWENKTGLSDGTYTIKAHINDTLGHTNQTETRTITLDTTAPTTTLTALISNGSSYTFNTWTSSTYVNVTLSCNDGSGVGCDKTLYCTDTVNTCTPNQVYSSAVQVSTSGTSYIRYLSNDTLNNIEAVNTQTVKIDLSNPLISYNSNADNGSYVKTWIFINITASDTNKDAVLFEWNGTNETFDNSDGDVYWENKTGLSDGTYTIKAHINDSAGKTNLTLLRNITLDTTSPTTTPTAVISNGSSYTFNTWTSSTYVNVTLSCNDGSGVGCDITYYCLDLADTCTPTTIYSSPVHISIEGTIYIRYKSKDVLGNEETIKSNITKIDTTAPIINSLKLIGNNLTNSTSFAMEVNATDVGVGLDTAYFGSISNSSWSGDLTILDINNSLIQSGTIYVNDSKGHITDISINYSIVEGVLQENSSYSHDLDTQIVMRNGTLFNYANSNLSYDLTYYNVSGGTIQSGGNFEGNLLQNTNINLISSWLGNWLEEELGGWEQNTNKTTIAGGNTYITRYLNTYNNISANFTNIQLNLQDRIDWSCNTINTSVIGNSWENITNAINCSISNIITKTQSDNYIRDDTVIVDNENSVYYYMSGSNGDNINYTDIYVSSTLPTFCANTSAYNFDINLTIKQSYNLTVNNSCTFAKETGYSIEASSITGFTKYDYTGSINITDVAVKEKPVWYVVPVSRLTSWSDAQDITYFVDDIAGGFSYSLNDENLTFMVPITWGASSLETGLHTFKISYKVTAAPGGGGGGGGGIISGYYFIVSPASMIFNVSETGEYIFPLYITWTGPSEHIKYSHSDSLDDYIVSPVKDNETDITDEAEINITFKIEDKFSDKIFGDIDLEIQSGSSKYVKTIPVEISWGLAEPPIKKDICGDGKCTGNETYISCPQDCPESDIRIIQLLIVIIVILCILYLIFPKKK